VQIFYRIYIKDLSLRDLKKSLNLSKNTFKILFKKIFKKVAQNA